MTSTRKGAKRGVLEFVAYLRVLLFLNNRSLVHFCGWGGGGGGGGAGGVTKLSISYGRHS